MMSWVGCWKGQHQIVALQAWTYKLKESTNWDEITVIEHCESCIMGKQHKLIFKLGSHSSKNTLEYVHANLWGPAQTSTHGGKI